MLSLNGFTSERLNFCDNYCEKNASNTQFNTYFSTLSLIGLNSLEMCVLKYGR